MGELIEFNRSEHVVNSGDNSQGESGLFDNQKEFLTYADLKSVTGFSERYLFKLIEKGVITRMRFGGKVRFDREDTLSKLRDYGRRNAESKT